MIAPLESDASVLISPIFGVGDRLSVEVRRLETIAFRRERGVEFGFHYRRVRWGPLRNVPCLSG